MGCLCDGLLYACDSKASRSSVDWSSLDKQPLAMMRSCQSVFRTTDSLLGARRLLPQVINFFAIKNSR
jgi:hypothetical protein